MKQRLALKREEAAEAEKRELAAQNKYAEMVRYAKSVGIAAK